MKSQYVIRAMGYEPQVIYTSLKEVRDTLRDFIKGDMEAGRARYGKVTKIKNGTDSYTIKIGGKQGYHIYSAYSIVKL